jgi:hypothetical protein
MFFFSGSEGSVGFVEIIGNLGSLGSVGSLSSVGSVRILGSGGFESLPERLGLVLFKCSKLSK